MTEGHHDTAFLDLGWLITQTQCLMRGHGGSGWDARAVNCTQFFHDDTAAGAMRKAIAFRDNKPLEATVRRRATFP